MAYKLIAKITNYKQSVEFFVLKEHIMSFI